MDSFFSILNQRIEKSRSLLCVGLDPHPGELEQFDAGSARSFCRRLVKNTSLYASAFKPNAAFFELHGSKGWDVLIETIELIREESTRLGVRIPVILDAKRGDIASTAEAYARSTFETIGADAITLNPYLGKDSVDPFLSYPGKGVFLLCKTSNRGAADLQDLILTVKNKVDDHKETTLYEHIASLAQSWNSLDNIGLVVGATHPEALMNSRSAAPDLWFLTPGVGAQGGDLEEALQNGLREDGKGMLINMSRSLSRSEDPGKTAAMFCEKVRETLKQISIKKAQA